MLSETCPFLNASGCWAADEEQIRELFDSGLGAVVTKTCTLFPRVGNPEPTFFSRDGIQVNSKGLPNQGYHYYKNICGDYFSLNRPIILSVLWESQQENTCQLLKDYDEFVGAVLALIGSTRYDRISKVDTQLPKISNLVKTYKIRQYR